MWCRELLLRLLRTQSWSSCVWVNYLTQETQESLTMFDQFQFSYISVFKFKSVSKSVSKPVSKSASKVAPLEVLKAAIEEHPMLTWKAWPQSMPDTNNYHSNPWWCYDLLLLLCSNSNICTVVHLWSPGTPWDVHDLPYLARQDGMENLADQVAIAIKASYLQLSWFDSWQVVQDAKPWLSYNMFIKIMKIS